MLTLGILLKQFLYSDIHLEQNYENSYKIELTGW